MMYWREIHCKISENPATKAVFFRGKSSAPAWSNQKAFFVAIMLPKLDQVDVNLITLRSAYCFYHFRESEGKWDENTHNLIKLTLAWSSWTWLCWYFGTSAGADLMMDRVIHNMVWQCIHVTSTTYEMISILFLLLFFSVNIYIDTSRMIMKLTIYC